MDTITKPLPPDIGNAIPGIVKAILAPIIDAKDAPKAREAPFSVVENLVPSGKTLRAESADEAGASAPPSQGESGAAPDPPAGCPSQPSPRNGPVRRQASQAPSDGESEGNSTAPDPAPPAPPPPVPSCPGANVGGNASGDGGGGDGGSNAGRRGL
jgi:hypothetical protein